MPQAQIQLRGWQALAALALLLAASCIRVSSRIQTVPDEGRMAVHDWLVRDYEGLGPAALAQRVAAYRAGERDLPTLPANPPDVQFLSVAAHGSPGTMIVRAEVTEGGGPPSDGRSVRYLALTTKVGGGWMVLAESDAYRYYTSLFD
jgi:hypothetical protein